MNESSHTHKPVRLALIGAGIYARDAHIPSLLNLDDRFEIVAIYSRTQESAQARAQEFGEDKAIEIYTDLAALLGRKDIEAVDVVLPIMLMPDVVKQALAAGKHVISEKPIAPDVATGKQLLENYANYPEQVWMVAENWRYESAYKVAAEMVNRGDIGRPLNCHWSLHLPITPANKYFANTPWRRAGDYQGGWLLDGGIHHTAALRTIMGEVTELSAMWTLHNPELAPLDTLTATLRFENGALGTYLANYTSRAFWPPLLHVVGDKGSIKIDRGQLEVATDGEPQVIDCQKFDGVENELAAFATSIRQRVPHLNSPEECLRDLALLEAMFQSAEQGKNIVPDPVVA